MIKKFYMNTIMAAVLVVLPSVTAKAQTLTPAQQAAVGTWDEGDGGIMDIYIQNGKLYGKVVHVSNKLDNNGVCKKCDGDLKNKPFVGMVAIYNFTPENNSDTWSGGRFVDLSSGLVAQGRIKAENSGATLNVRGYIGAPALGQTSIWKRIK